MLFVIRMDILNFRMETIVYKLEPWRENSYYSKKNITCVVGWKKYLPVINIWL